MTMVDKREPDQSTKLKQAIAILSSICSGNTSGTSLVTPVEEAVLVTVEVNGTPTVCVQEIQVNWCVTVAYGMQLPICVE